ncbi:hypothetical protein F5050DRAFT_187206 [Lentinula boryana]|uniref:Secreted protein n=1 Tax=Lentinula boryana TaxID=40481 RepID=A0ABQ8QRF0_9AGAR|nr:hypothetical protein F5050DRAFT_187206 [Lentinula boryana]
MVLRILSFIHPAAMFLVSIYNATGGRYCILHMFYYANAMTNWEAFSTCMNDKKTFVAVVNFIHIPGLNHSFDAVPSCGLQSLRLSLSSCTNTTPVKKNPMSMFFPLVRLKFTATCSQ